MTCAEVDDRMDHYVDGALGEREFQEIELHLHGCESCREQERRLRSLLAQAAALPRELAPARDLWPGVAKRLGHRRLLAFSPRSGTLRAWLPALAAAALLVLALGVTLRSRVAPPARQVSTEPSGVSRPVDASVEPTDLLGAEHDYASAAAALLAALESRREQLSPETMVAVEKDLLVIDQALADIRRALAKDPASGALNHLLVSTHQRKVKVLQRVVKLSRI